MSYFDVSNLFTNVPLDETINVCLDSLYTSSNDAIIGLPKNLFKQFLKLSVKNIIFCVQFKTVQTIGWCRNGASVGAQFQ